MKNLIILPKNVPVLSILMGGGTVKEDETIQDPSGMKQCNNCNRWVEIGVMGEPSNCPFCGEKLTSDSRT